MSDKKDQEVIEKAEVIEVVNLDEFQELDAGLQKQIITITEELNLKQIKAFNPLIVGMIEVEKLRELKFDAEDPEHGKKYEDAVRTVKSYRAKVSKTKSLIKKPLLETGRGLDKIEKAFKDKATDVYSYLDKVFKPYIDEKARKKAEREAKKMEAKNKEINELAAENQQNNLVIQRMNVSTSIRKDISKIIQYTNECIENFSVDKLIEHLEDLQKSNQNQLQLTEEQKKVLLPEQIEELNSEFISTTDLAIQLVDNVIKNKQVEFEKQVQTEAEKISGEIKPVTPEEAFDPPANDSGAMVAPSLADKNPNYIRDSICTIIDEAIAKIQNLQPALDIEKNVIGRTIAGLTQYKGKISDSFKKQN